MDAAPERDRKRKGSGVSGSRLHHVTRAITMGALLWLAWTVAILLPSQSTRGIAVGNAAPRDIKASRQVTYVSNVETGIAREEAALRVPEVYTGPDQGRRHSATGAPGSALKTAVTAARAREDSSPADRLALLEELPDVDLTDDAWEAMLDMSDSSWDALRAGEQLVCLA